MFRRKGFYRSAALSAALLPTLVAFAVGAAGYAFAGDSTGEETVNCDNTDAGKLYACATEWAAATCGEGSWPMWDDETGVVWCEYGDEVVRPKPQFPVGVGHATPGDHPAGDGAAKPPQRSSGNATDARSAAAGR